MKITKRQLRRIIKEEITRMQEIAPRMKGSGNEHPAIGQWDTNNPSDPLQIAIALRNTWDEVSRDVDIHRPTPANMADESMSMLSTYYPEEAEAIMMLQNAKKWDEIDRIVAKAFPGFTGWDQ